MNLKINEVFHIAKSGCFFEETGLKRTAVSAGHWFENDIENKTCFVKRMIFQPWAD